MAGRERRSILRPLARSDARSLGKVIADPFGSVNRASLALPRGDGDSILERHIKGADPMHMFDFDNSYARDLPGFWLPQRPAQTPAPKVLKLNTVLLAQLGMTSQDIDFAQVFSGNHLPDGAEPLAQAYAGHQFGGFSAQLGDGRALLLGEVIDDNGQRRDIALKGSGRTPFSRGGDGKAAIGPVLREYLVAEAMHALGVPTTRALAAVTTGAPVLRETELPGAVFTRVAASHLRVGTFQFFAARGEADKLRLLADYAIQRHYPYLQGADKYMEFFQAVAARQAHLIAQWMGLGFIHGVMNTDNMTISGETIDYGPCAFMDAYAPGTVFSSIDRQGRYAYANQPLILGWNLAKLAEALLPLLDPNPERAVDRANDALDQISHLYQEEYLTVMRKKLGLPKEDSGDATLIDELSELMAQTTADWTTTFRALAEGRAPVFAHLPAGQAWLARWKTRRGTDAGDLRLENPLYIPRNHLVEEALAAATVGDMVPFEALLDRVTAPFTEAPDSIAYTLPAPTGFGPYRTFCGT